MLAQTGAPAVFSYAGRTRAPAPQPLPTRIGGFGGVEGLRAYLRAERIGAVVDATHPFAAGMSTNAVAACAAERVPLAALERPPWTPVPGDDWRRVVDMAGAVAALGAAPRRVFLATGRQDLARFKGLPHAFLVRLVDPPETPLPLDRVTVEIARGPFDRAADRALMARHGIELVVAKNAGGTGARAKLDAAHDLRIGVVMIDRPAIPPRRVLGTVGETMGWLGHVARLGV